jgi:hypothetical protein
MLGGVLRLPGRLLGVLALGALVAQAAWVSPRFLALAAGSSPAARDSLFPLLWPAVLVGAGRVLLSFAPPGEVGGHGPRSLPATLAASLILGLLGAHALEGAADPVFLATLVLALALARWSTLPGAMVPRHGVASEARGPLDLVLGALAAAWAAYVLSDGDAELLAWFAVGVLLYHALGVARRGRGWRQAVLVLFVLASVALDSLGALAGLFPALSLALGAAFSIGWLRRADRRAGALAGVGFGSAFLGGCDALALAGVLVFVLASRPRQRWFACAWAGTAGGLALALAWLEGRALPAARGRALLAEELGIQLARWGIAWPILLGALVLGALSFRWRVEPWRPDQIEEPRRESIALGALLALACLALALPLSPWGEEEALVILFPPSVLLAALLLIPPARLPGARAPVP